MLTKIVDFKMKIVIFVTSICNTWYFRLGIVGANRPGEKSDRSRKDRKERKKRRKKKKDNDRRLDLKRFPTVYFISPNSLGTVRIPCYDVRLENFKSIQSDEKDGKDRRRRKKEIPLHELEDQRQTQALALYWQ